MGISHNPWPSSVSCSSDTSISINRLTTAVIYRLIKQKTKSNFTKIGFGLRTDDLLLVFVCCNWQTAPPPILLYVFLGTPTITVEASNVDSMDSVSLMSSTITPHIYSCELLVVCLFDCSLLFVRLYLLLVWFNIFTWVMFYMYL